MPAFPSSGSTNWYAYAQALDTTARGAAQATTQAYDSFTANANGAIATLDSGQAYNLYQNDPAVAFTVTSGYLTHPLLATTGSSAAYAGVQLTSTVGRIWADFVIPSTGTGTPESIVLIVSAGRFAQAGFSNAASHFVITQTDWSYQTLDASPFGTTVVASGTFITPLATDTVHHVAVDFLSDRAAITLPGGARPVLTAPTPKILSYRGAHATIELFANVSNAAKAIKVQAWGADTEVAVASTSPFASRGDLGRALDTVPAAPRSVVYSPATTLDYAITTAQAAPNAAMAILVEYPASGRVRWEFDGYFWPTSGTTFGTGVYVWLLFGSSTRGGGQIAFGVEGEGFHHYVGVLTGTPGTSETLVLNVSAGANGAANFTASDPRGIAAVISTTPLG